MVLAPGLGQVKFWGLLGRKVDPFTLGHFVGGAEVRRRGGSEDCRKREARGGGEALQRLWVLVEWPG